MANGYFERGEIYWVRMDSGFGMEQGVGRPGLIITSDNVNQKQTTVTIAFMSKKYHAFSTYVPVDATGETTYVIINQLMSVDKSRLGKMIGVLNRAEQKAVDDALEETLDLGYADEAALTERDEKIAELEEKIARQKEREAELKKSHEEELVSYKVEVAMWQKLYEKALAQVVDMKFAGDLARRVPVVVEESEETEERVEAEVEGDDRVDINSCTITALRKIGFNASVAKRIVDGRPYGSVSDLKGVSGIKATHFRIMEPKLCCTPIVEERKVVSAPVEPDVGYEEEHQEVVPAVKKVNVNTASAQEIHDATGLNKTVCFSITGNRKRNGAYSSLDDLLNVPRFLPVHLEKYGAMLEV